MRGKKYIKMSIFLVGSFFGFVSSSVLDSASANSLFIDPSELIGVAQADGTSVEYPGVSYPGDDGSCP